MLLRDSDADGRCYRRDAFSKDSRFKKEDSGIKMEDFSAEGA